MVEILLSISFLMAIGLMILLANTVWISRKLTKHQLELIELEVQKLKQSEE